jgi:HEAT repeat protein
MNRISYLSLVLLAVCSSPLSAADRPEPKFKGKPLAYWVDRLQQAPTDDEQGKAADAIAAFGPDAGPAVPRLIEMLDDRSGDFRELVTRVLCEIGPGVKDAVPALVKSLKEKSARSPSCVFQILGAIGPDAKEAVPVLVESLRDPKTVQDAVRTLCSIGPAAEKALPAIRATIRQYHKKDPKGDSYSHWLLYPLPKFGASAVPLLAEFLDDKAATYRGTSAELLGEIGPAAKDATPNLRKLLKDADAEVRYKAARAVWTIEMDPAVVPVFAELLGSYPIEMRVSAAERLGEIGPGAKAALPALERARDNSAGAVQIAAEQAMLRIKGGEGRQK